MTTASHVLAGIAVLASACIYGADLFAGLVLRAALSHLDDHTLTTTMGYIHRYGDRRLPAPFLIGLAATILTTATAALDGRTAAAVAGGVAVTAFVAWIGLFFRVSAPINRELITAALAGETPANVRALQQQWDRIIPVRFGLQTIAVAALCTTLALP